MKTASAAALVCGLLVVGVGVYGQKDRPKALKTPDKQAFKMLFPADSREVFEKSEHFEVLSLDPQGFEMDTDAKGNPLKPDQIFHQYPIISRVEIKDKKQKAALIAALYDGIARSRTEAACFEPNHGLRAARGKKTV